MACEEVSAWGQALTADGTTTGYVTVADTSGFYPGAEAWLSSSAAQQRVIITEIKSGTQVGVRFVATEVTNSSALMYGSRSSAAAFTTALGSRLDMPQQLVRVIQPSFSKRTLA